MIDLLENHHTIAIIGMAKNAGKTTSLNHIISTLKNEIIGLTSIGLDGEEFDNVTFLPKPDVVVYPNMIVATAKDCLTDVNFNYEVLHESAIRTPLGVIVIVRVHSEGTVVLAGPSTNQTMKEILKIMKQYQTKHIFIDGALFRKSIASHLVSDAIILATGASYDHDMNSVILATKTVAQTYRFPAVDSNVYETLFSFNRPVKITSDQLLEVAPFQTLVGNEMELYHFIKTGCTLLYIPSAITEKWIDVLVSNHRHFTSFDLVINDASKLVLSSKYIEYLQKLDVKVSVLHPIKLLAVTLNPYSPNGYIFEKDQFHHQLSKSLMVPVFNVLEMSDQNGKT